MVEPMVWKYVPKLSQYLKPDLWQKYAAIFPHVWIASAFKGATGRSQYITNITHHKINHESWLRQLRRHCHKFKSIHGIVLTGWQRYDHFAPLCELLPVGIPSLLVCMQTITHGMFDDHVVHNVSDTLKCEGNVELTPKPNLDKYVKCNFPGSDLYDAVHTLYFARSKVNEVKARIPNFMSDYNVKHKYVNSVQLETTIVELAMSAQSTLRNLTSPVTKMLERIYFPDTVTEWVDTHILQPLRDMDTVLERAEPLRQLKSWPKRPLSDDN